MRAARVDDLCLAALDRLGQDVGKRVQRAHVGRGDVHPQRDPGLDVTVADGLQVAPDLLEGVQELPAQRGGDVSAAGALTTVGDPNVRFRGISPAGV